MSLALDYLAKCSLVNRASCPDLAELLLFQYNILHFMVLGYNYYIWKSIGFIL